MKKRLIPAAAAGCCFFLGFESGSYQYVVASAAGEFGLAAVGMGLLVTVQFLASMISPALCGGLAERFGRKRVFGGFMTVFSLGCLGAFLSRGAAAFALGVFAIGLGYSMCEGLASVVAAGEGGQGAGGAVNLVQAAFSLGAVSGPWAADFATRVRGLDWRSMFLAAGAGCGMMLTLLALGGKSAQKEMRTGAGQRNRGGIGPRGGFLLLVVLMFSYAMIETGGLYFIDTLRAGLSGESRVSAYGISSVWLSMTASRLIASRIGTRWGFPVITCGFLTAAAAILGLSLCRGEAGMIGACVLMGIAMGPVWPMLVGCAIDWFPDRAALAASRLVMAGSAGGAFMPVLMGGAADAFGIRGAYCVAAAVGALACVAACFWSFWSVRVQKKGEGRENGF